jgi:hypothetical protein
MKVLFTSLILLVLSGCTVYDQPEVVFVPQPQTAVNPVVVDHIYREYDTDDYYYRYERKDTRW